MSKVYVLKTDPATVVDDYIRLIRQAEADKCLDPGTATILKDNISWHFPYLSANTTPWQLEGTIRGLKELGFNDLTCVQNKTVVTNAFKGEKLNKYIPIFEKYDIPVLYNFREDDMKWVTYEPKGEILVLDKIFPEGIRIPDYFFGKNVVHLPTMKCHIYTTTTGAMKNAFGGLLNTKRHYTHSVIHETLVDLLTIQKEIHPGMFAVMDGTVCGNGPGPRTMEPVEKDYILAGADQVAIDAVAAKMMGFDPMSLPYIRIAHEKGLGTGDFRHIEIIGEDVEKINFRFSVGDNLASTVGDLLWFGPLKALQNMFFRTPLVNLFIFGSFFYHDYFWWPARGKKKMEYFKKNYRWGKLFDSYSE
ncbi:MAG: iron-sulfur cluster-binding protein [Firmicutes bacterium HGW-Firmicutes-14]|nr:MAG: iron-sulfur cluster-binding protein [Firmicutes bacterium HGW-Firmicutes-14]